ncbi:MAG: mechanosensitive ion channel family protein [Anaerolineae bacterium]|jgi:small conductance mechanosensitive channel
MWDAVLLVLWRIFLAAVILIAGWIATKIIVRLAERYLTRAKIDTLLVNFACSVLNWTLLVVVVIAALSTLGIDTTALIALLGAAGIAIGIALQDSLKNFASGVLLIIFRPFSVGDSVEAAGTSGIVEEITLFTTMMRSPDNRSVIVPNGAIYSDTITNNTARDTRRVDMVFGIGYEDDMRQARDLMMEIIKSDERVLSEPAPAVVLGELADSSVNFNVRPWCRTEDYWDVMASITEKIKLAFDDHGISIPYPQMDVHVADSGTPLNGQQST